jgi:hypothetical protein
MPVLANLLSTQRRGEPDEQLRVRNYACDKNHRLVTGSFMFALLGTAALAVGVSAAYYAVMTKFTDSDD